MGCKSTSTQEELEPNGSGLLGTWTLVETQLEKENGTTTTEPFPRKDLVPRIFSIKFEMVNLNRTPLFSTTGYSWESSFSDYHPLNAPYSSCRPCSNEHPTFCDNCAFGLGDYDSYYNRLDRDDFKSFLGSLTIFSDSLHFSNIHPTIFTAYDSMKCVLRGNELKLSYPCGEEKKTTRCIDTFVYQH